MSFDDILDQAITILQRRGRVTYRTLKRQFALDDAALEDLKFAHSPGFRGKEHSSLSENLRR